MKLLFTYRELEIGAAVGTRKSDVRKSHSYSSSGGC